MARLWRAYRASLPSRVGARVELGPEESHHVRRVLRLEAGEMIAVFDADGREWLATLLPAESEGVVVQLAREVRQDVEPPLEVTLYQALGRSQQVEWVIQKATEIGVAAVHPLRTRRSERFPVRPQRMERWRRIAVESCKQCGRRRVPLIDGCDELPAAEPGSLALVLDPGGAAPPLASHLEALDEGAPPARVLLVCGPESGLDDGEIAAWCDAGWQRAGLGPRILRAETAGIVAATIVLNRWGDLGR
jgi:16S rRNA (uracil1498-N3)-methyltransferase